MSDIAGTLGHVRATFENPFLRLLDRKWAPLVLAVFQNSFSSEQKSIQADRLHTQVDAYLAELQSVGEETPPMNGRALCKQWVGKDKWLRCDPDGNGEEIYSLASAALDALSLVSSLSHDRALVSESRLTTILDTVRRLAMEANPDRGDRIERLNAQIAQLTSERDRLQDGGEILAASDERMLDGCANLVDLIGQLPSDFKRVEESVLGMHRTIIGDFRSEERPIGAVLDEYLAKTDELMTATAEGRAFAGAFDLLRDDVLLRELRDDLQLILDHPFATALSANERRNFRNTVTVIRTGIDDVLAQRNRLTTTLRDHIVNHDVVKDRELDSVLRQINKQLSQWMQTAGPRATVPLHLTPDALRLEHLRERFYDPRSEAPPPELENVSDDAPEPLSIAELRKQGGPLLDDLRRALSASCAGGSGQSVGETFNALPADLRRPVEIFGLLHLATQVEALERADGAEPFEAIRPDGTKRTFAAPRITLDEHEVSELSVLDEEPSSIEERSGV